MTTVKRDFLVNHINDLLKINHFKDYGPNGLQIEGQSHIESMVAGVTLTQDLIEAAIDLKADSILVHHGLFWKGEPFPLVGVKHKRCKALIEANINLIAYHLPLDAHPSIGNNAQLGKRLNLPQATFFDLDGQPGLGAMASIESPLQGEDLKQTILNQLKREPLYIAGSNKPITKIAWCTGGAQRYIHDAYAMGANAYITGEASIQVVDFAKEVGMHFYAAGHHATERYGVKALGDYLINTFDLKVTFLDLDNPV